MRTIFLSIKTYICLSLLFFLPLLGAEQHRLACECEENLAPEQAPAVIVVSPPQKAPETVIRAAIDIGSGATKLRVAEINLKTHKIDKILVNESFPVQYQEHLSKSSNNTFDDEVMKTGITAIEKSEQIAAKYHPQKVIAVATASFRKAANSQAFIDEIYKETGVHVYVIDQELEGTRFQCCAFSRKL